MYPDQACCSPWQTPAKGKTGAGLGQVVEGSGASMACSVFMMTLRSGLQLLMGKCGVSDNTVIDFPGISGIFVDPWIRPSPSTADFPSMPHLAATEHLCLDPPHARASSES